MAKNFSVGYSNVNVNPPLGAGMIGYYVPRKAKGFLDDLEIRTMVISCDDKRVAIISLPICLIHDKLLKEVFELITKNTCIKQDEIFLTATHTHTGPFLIIEEAGDFGEPIDEEKHEQYRKFFCGRVVDGIKLAINDLKPAKMGYCVGYAPERVAYIRRYMMKDGTTYTCPPIDDPNIDYPLGTLDQRVNVVRFDREGADTIVLYNYGLHADTIGGELISSDWPHWTNKTLEKALDGVKGIFIAGAQGDVGSTNVHPKDGDMNDTEISFDNEMKSPGMARFVGRAIAGTILQVYDKVKYVDVDDLSIIKREIKIPSNKPKPEELPLAKKYVELHEAGLDSEIPYKAMQLTTVVAEALRMIRLEKGPDHFDLTLTGLKLGPIAFVGIAGEPFTEVGVEIKKAEGWGLILPCALTNGSMGYFPMKSAYEEGGYEARCSSFKAGVGEIIIEESKKLLSDLKNS